MSKEESVNPEQVIRRYYIKENYKPNLNPSYYVSESEEDLVWQTDVYKMAQYLAEKLQAEYIIDVGSGDGKKLCNFEERYKIIAVDYGENRDILYKNITPFMFIEANLEEGFADIEDATLSRSVIIMADVIEHIINPDRLLFDLTDVAQHCLALLISTPDRDLARGVSDMGPPPNPCHVREWNMKEFECLLKHYGINPVIAHTRPHDKTNEYNTMIAISFGNDANKAMLDEPICSLIIYPHLDSESRVKTHQVLELAKYNDELIKTIDDLKRENNELLLQCDGLNKQVADIYASKSWKIGHGIIRIIKLFVPNKKNQE